MFIFSLQLKLQLKLLLNFFGELQLQLKLQLRNFNWLIAPVIVASTHLCFFYILHRCKKITLNCLTEGINGEIVKKLKRMPGFVLL